MSDISLKRATRQFGLFSTWKLVALVSFLCVVVLFSLTAGAIPVSLGKLLTANISDFEELVLFNIRLPRILLAVAVGAALGMSGAAMQGLFRNPLADPGLIGISGGAALAVAVMIVVVGPLPGVLGLYGLGFAAFSGGIVTSLFILRLSRLTGAFSVTQMLLAGIAINALTFAGTGFLTFFSDDQELRALTFWTMGSLGGALWPPVVFILSVILPTFWILNKKSKELNIFMLGEENATYVGVNVKRLKLVIIICAAVSVGAAVAVSGLIGFVGLVVPHLIRLSISSDHRYLVPLSALVGAALLLFADTVARIIVLPSEMPVGVLTSLIGGPFFLWLLIRQSKMRF
jgi:heme transport system permease protein